MSVIAAGLIGGGLTAMVAFENRSVRIVASVIAATAIIVLVGMNS